MKYIAFIVYPVNGLERTGELTVTMRLPNKNLNMTTDERYRFIRSCMVAEGVTIAQIARDEKVRIEYVYYVLKCQRTGYRIRRAIAKAVKKSVQVLWPDTPEDQRNESSSNALFIQKIELDTSSTDSKSTKVERILIEKSKKSSQLILSKILMLLTQNISIRNSEALMIEDILKNRTKVIVNMYYKFE